MTKAAFIVILSFSFSFVHSQQGFLVVKKKGKTIQRFSNGSIITFQTNDGEWISGDISQLRPDSFYIRPRSVRLTMAGADTVHFATLKIAYKDISTLPRKSAMVFYRNDKPQLIHGHEKFVYIKNGLLLRLLAGGYAAASITNSLIDHEPPFGKKNRPKLGVAAAVFLIGHFMRSKYHQYLSLGKKYRLQYIDLGNTK